MGVALLLMLWVVVPATAQEDLKALAVAIDSLQYGKFFNDNDEHREYGSPDIKNAVLEQIYERNKKNPEVAYLIAKSFYIYRYDEEKEDIYNDEGVLVSTRITRTPVYATRDTVGAFKYIYRATHIDTTYTPVYVLAADILTMEGMYDRAMDWYNTAIAANPKDSVPYLKRSELLAKTDIKAAVEKLEEMRKSGANYDVDLQIARLYVDHYKDASGISRDQMREVVRYFDAAKREGMNETDLSQYAVFNSRSYHDESDYDTIMNKSIEIAEWGEVRFPKDFGLHALLMGWYYQKKRYQDAINQYDLMMASENVQKRPEDLINLGKIYTDMKNYQKAIDVFDNILAMKDINPQYKTNAETLTNAAMRQMIQKYEDDGEYDKAINVFSSFLEQRRKENKLNATLMDTYAKIYVNMSLEKNGQEKLDALQKADEIYQEMLDLFPQQDIYGAYQRWFVHAQMDPQNEQGIAVPYAEKLIEVILSKNEELTAGRKNQLINAYWTICYRAATSTPVNKAKVKETGIEILALKPDHPGVPRIFEALKIKM